MIDEKIICMDEHRPHMVIQTDKACHVYPESYFEDFADGKDVEPIPLDVMRVIVKGWLKGVSDDKNSEV